MSLGEERVRVKFNPSDNSLVSQIKQKTAELIDLCERERKRAQASGGVANAEVWRHYSMAMDDYETAAMYAVKGATS